MLKIAKMTAKSPIKPVLNAVYFKGDKIVATDSFRLIEVVNPHATKLDVLIHRSNFTSTKDVVGDDGKVLHPDGKAVVPTTVDEEFPEYERTFPSDKDIADHYTRVLVNRTFLIELLEAMQGDQVDLFVPMREKGMVLSKPLMIKNTNLTARALLMPIVN